MHYIIIGIIVLALALFTLVTGCSRGNAEPEKPTPGKGGPVHAGAVLTRAEVIEQLNKLAAEKPPKTLKPGAMCYSMAGPPERVEYVCPACGEKTLYVRNDDNWMGKTWLIQYELDGCRRYIKKIQGLDITLDESSLCAKCKPDAKERGLELVIRYPDQEEEHRVANISSTDLQFIHEFTTGNKKHSGMTGQETPLKNHIPNLRRLLGVEEEQPGPQTKQEGI